MNQSTRLGEQTQCSARSKPYTPDDEADTIEIIPLLALDLKSTNNQFHLPAMKRLLNIVLKGPECLDEFYSQGIPEILKKFLSLKESDEKFVISSTILHVISVYDKISDQSIRMNAAIQPLLQMIHSLDEDRSNSACQVLQGLIKDNSVRSSLLSTGFLGMVQHTLSIDNIEKNESLKEKQSSQQQEQQGTAVHVKLNLLEIVLKVLTTCDEQELQPLSFLIPMLEELKSKGVNQLKNSAKNILCLLIGYGVSSSSSSSSKQDCDKIHELEEKNKQLEETTKRLEDEHRRDQEENRKLKEETAKQKVKIEKLKIKLPQNLQISAISQDTDDIVSTTEANGKLKISKKQTKHNTISLNPVLENGVYSVEAEFLNTFNGYECVGIVRDSYTVPAGTYPTSSPHNQHIAVFTIQAGYNGNVYYKGIETKGNTGFAQNQIIKMEYDSEKGTVILFVNGKQQPVYISGIKEKIRFMVC
ncbi:MAG: hypothetical protein EZS28_005578 [Streblomastix strix]|uniref:Uncharacterized protein n=1 Tax=Streblomastix strix TaxID=222440 RepID=A0A5J4WV87_9EUKA|nr:MAG: hypothetical protein EZS28_005578 [Streblomastix strix]